NAKMDLFEDKTLPVEKRVDDLLRRMTKEEKLGQMIQYTFPKMKFDPNNPDGAEIDVKNIDTKKRVESGMIGSLFGPIDKTAPETRKLMDNMNEWSQSTRINIPLLLGIDAIHGVAFTTGATVFPVPLN
ncbi:MAG: hypothetical protein NTY32_10250, partial [Bacteroidia bacterium]|nr:hypothetical protein [Bacteroidia bacterium]